MESIKTGKIAALLLCFALADCSAAASDARELVPVGRTVAIEIETQGVVITALTKVDTASGEAEPAYDAGLRAGDVIEYIGSRRIDCPEDLKKALEEECGELSVRYTRGGRQYQTAVTPVLGTSGRYELGVWLRSGLSGLGTVTFIDPEDGSFGALGHSVNDIETGVVLPLREGSIYYARIDGAVKGEKGSPGELRGSSSGEKCGEIDLNDECGIFGNADDGAFGSGDAIPVMPRRELKCGEAYILSDVGKGPVRYKAEISRIYRGSECARDYLITVTDDELISLTGGIVQGMSGSPVIQNGKIVGAVTHVLIGDPTKGYGIFMDRMLDAAA
ncbi:MAG: SpoIVB peptidase [Oscillospiraceae bacterium]|nr:SpoIVB peptidase [Oscillospiraceae bacterium]